MQIPSGLVSSLPLYYLSFNNNHWSNPPPFWNLEINCVISKQYSFPTKLPWAIIHWLIAVVYGTRPFYLQQIKVLDN